MNGTRAQRGWSLISIALVLLVAGVFVLVGLRLYPGYYEAFNVRKAMESLRQNPDISAMSKVSIWDSLEKHFDISSMYNPSPKRENLRVDFNRETGRKLIELNAFGGIEHPYALFEWNLPLAFCGIKPAFIHAQNQCF